MATDLGEKTDRYEQLLSTALAGSNRLPPRESPMGAGADECLEMARAYLEDGRHFRSAGESADALAAFAYGHGWLDAASRLGLVTGPAVDHLSSDA